MPQKSNQRDERNASPVPPEQDDALEMAEDDDDFEDEDFNDEAESDEDEDVEE